MEETEEYEDCPVPDKPVEVKKIIQVDVSKNYVSTDEKLEILAEQIKIDTANTLKD